MKIEERNWKEIQEFYDAGNSTRNIIDKFELNYGTISKASKLGYIKIRNKSEAGIIGKKKYPLVHTEEWKKNMSEIRKKYLKENPDKVPYRLNHSSKESYPEKYFAELFQKENIIVDRYIPISYYELDFCITDKKINIEIDGEQHYLDKKIKVSDNNRNTYLENNGWKTIRIRWSDYQKMDYEGKAKYISELKDYINILSNDKPTIPFIENGKKMCECGAKICKTSVKCVKCAHLVQVRVSFDIEKLLKEKETNSYEKLGVIYGVSGNTIKKWIKKAS